MTNKVSSENTRRSVAELKAILIQKIQSIVQPIRVSADEAVRILIRQVLEKNETIKALTDGFLRGDFGLEHDVAVTAVAAIIDMVMSKITTDVKTDKKATTIRIVVGAIGLEDISTIPGFSYVSIPSEEEIPWLEWLLTKGTEIVVDDYHVKYVEGIGRSGLAEMRDGEFFRVDPQHSGKIGNNFITRAIEGAKPEISRILSDSIKKNVSVT